jgi:SOS-response transcriptional repressor LexA
MKALGMTQAQLAEKVGLSQVAIHLLLTGKSSTTKKPAEIARALDVDVDWLLSGKGFISDPQNSHTANIEPGPDVRGLVPLISWVTAGAWVTAEDPYEIGDAEQWVPCPITHGHHTFVLKVRGESMEPEYRDGDWIFVDPDREVLNGSHVVVRMEGTDEATFKKLVIEGEDRFLMALNAGWPERIIRINGNATIVGVVIFSGKPRV